MLACLSRYTHRVAIPNSRLLKANGNTVTFRVKSDRANGPQRADNIERARVLLGVATPAADAASVDATVEETSATDLLPCPCCGGRQRIIETFLRGETPRHRPSPRPIV